MWITESNREKHFIGGAVLALFLTILCTIGAAGGMEFKDKQWGGKWDWLDFLATILGGIVGQVIQLIIMYSIYIIIA